jgi:hypothetical protein
MSRKLLISIIIPLIICSAVLIQNVSSDPIAPPSQLKIYVSPPTVPADNTAYNCIFVQLQDSSGNPARAQQDTAISLSSSLTEIGTVDPAITIPSGATYGSANFYATFTPGTTTITATATGYGTVETPITTVGPKPYTLAVYGFPATLPSDGGSYDAIMVQLQDSTGAPAKAPVGGSRVTLSSSNLLVGDVTPSVTITEGQTYAIATFTTTVASGHADITAIASDYGSTRTTITTVAPTSMSSGKLVISTGTAKVLADNTAYKQIAVEILDKDNNLGTATSNITVTIASADESIGKTETQITIPQSKSYALATFSSTYKAGTTTLTAAASNFEAASKQLTTTGFTASKLAVYCVPSALPSDRQAYQAVQVQLQDSAGHPAPAPADLTVNLFSSQPSVGTVNPRLTIPLGQTWTTGTLTVTNTPGETTVTAQASSYSTGQAKATTCTIDYSKLAVSVTAAPQTVYNGNQSQITAYITVEGNPVAGASVQFRSDNNGAFGQTQEGQSGYYTATFTAPSFAKTTTCTITVDASKTGYLNSQGTTQVTVALPSNTTVAASNSTSTVTGIKTGSLVLYVLDADGNSVSNAQVFSVNQPSGIGIISGVTNQTGYVTLEGLVAGSYVFQITKEGYAALLAPIEYKGTPLSMDLALANSPEGDNTLLFIIVGIVVAVVIAALGVVMVKHRRPSKAKTLQPLNWPMKS